ncbi:hypothetical protein C8F01DRAFT_1258834 [Mycena amicta]|nr:hypothetical protein C8F01DRAFT_1258834 [Mycena amicta]
MAATSKTLSTSTMGLRFMQNAALRRGTQPEELDKAAVKDDVDGEWEIPRLKEIREAWSASASASSGSGPGASAGDVSYEASYIPFLFAGGRKGEGDGEERLVKGRRTFKKGREVDNEPLPPTTDMLPESSSSSSARSKPKPPGNIRSISSQAGGLSGGKKDGKGQGKKPSVSARDAVFNNANADTGTDLRETETRKQTANAPAPPPPAVFLRPAGIDAPPAPPPAKSKSKTRSKRPRDVEDGEGDGEGEGEGEGETTESKPKKAGKKKKLKKSSEAEDP